MTRRKRRLYAYLDGELGRLGRWRLEAALRRSPELRRALGDLRGLRALAREAESSRSSPDIWPAIAGRLASIDAQVEIEHSERSARPRGLPVPWMLASAGVAAAALAIVLSLGPTPTGTSDPLGVSTAGVIRYLDTGERSVMLVEDQDDVTIIWLMDPPGGEA